MSKYEPLGKFLARSKRARVEVSFDKIEELIGGELPPSAHRHRAFWSNNPTGHAHARAWIEAGYESDIVDIEGQRIVFQRSEAAKTPAQMTPAERKKRGEELWNGIYGCLKGTGYIPEGVDITEPVELEWDAMKD